MGPDYRVFVNLQVAVKRVIPPKSDKSKDKNLDYKAAEEEARSSVGMRSASHRISSSNILGGRE